MIYDDEPYKSLFFFTTQVKQIIHESVKTYK